MTWQFLLMCFLILGTVVALLQRQLGKTIPQYNRLVNGVFFIAVHFPLAIVTGLVIGFDVNIGWTNMAILAATAVIAPLGEIFAYRASKNVDAGLLGIISTMGPVITIVLAALLLSQELSPWQLVGALIITFSALSVSIATYSHSRKSTKLGIAFALAYVLLWGACTVFESWMLKRISLGSVIVYWIGFQALWMAVLAWPQRKHIGIIVSRQYGPRILAFSLAKSVKGIVFVAALFVSQSAAIVGAFSGFQPVIVVIAAYIFLHEKYHLKIKALAAVAGLVGLIILSLG